MRCEARHHLYMLLLSIMPRPCTVFQRASYSLSAAAAKYSKVLDAKNERSEDLSSPLRLSWVVSLRNSLLRARGCLFSSCDEKDPGTDAPVRSAHASTRRAQPAPRRTPALPQSPHRRLAARRPSPALERRRLPSPQSRSSIIVTEQHQSAAGTRS